MLQVLTKLVLHLVQEIGFPPVIPPGDLVDKNFRHRMLQWEGYSFRLRN